MAFEIVAVSNGNGRHMYYLSDASLVEASKWGRATTPPNLVACALARISLCLFFMRIVSRRRRYIIFLWTLIFLNVTTNIASIVRLLASCQPLEKLWNHNVPGTCWPTYTGFITGMIQAVVSISTDWLIALFPILILRNLNMARKTKIALIILMGMGIFAGAAALIKTLHLYSVTTRADTTWDTSELTCWSMYVPSVSRHPLPLPSVTRANLLNRVEQNVGIITVSIPAIRPLFSRIFKIGSSADNLNPYKVGYDLGNMAGRHKGPAYPTIVSNVSARNKPAAAGDTSEFSLVGQRVEEDGDGIKKTVSVSLRSQRLEWGEGPEGEEGSRGRDGLV